MQNNYPGAILIAYRLYCKFIKEVKFDVFEKLVFTDYNKLVNDINNFKRG